MKNQHITIKIKNAMNGLGFAWQDEANFRAHILSGLAALLLFSIVQPAAIWWALIVLCIALVLAAELINSAIEALSDHLHPDIHPSIGKVKDMLAGMVLIVSIAAAVVALLALVSTLNY
jgi:diacylglycerol kinase